MDHYLSKEIFCSELDTSGCFNTVDLNCCYTCSSSSCIADTSCTVVRADMVWTSGSCDQGTFAGDTFYCEGDKINIRGDFLGSCANVNNPYLQINARSLDETCTIQLSGGDMSGLTIQDSTSSLSGLSNADVFFSGEWTVPAIPADCGLKTAWGYRVELWDGPPETGTLVTCATTTEDASSSCPAGAWPLGGFVKFNATLITDPIIITPPPTPKCEEVEWDPPESTICSGVGTFTQYKCKGNEELEETQDATGTKVCSGETTCWFRTATSHINNPLILPTNSFQTISSSLSSGSDTKRYLVYIPITGTYEFSFCPFDGGNANWDTYLCFYDSAQNEILSISNDDFCNSQSKIFMGLGDGIYYIQVSGWDDNDYGDYTLAYKGSPPLDVGQQECYDWDTAPTAAYSAWGDRISEVRYGPYCANNYAWRWEDVDNDGDFENYMVIPDGGSVTYIAWAECTAQPGRTVGSFRNFGADVFYGCLDANCDKIIENADHASYRKTYTEPSSTITYPDMVCFVDGHGWGFLGGTLINRMVLNCGVDADCGSGKFCKKPVPSDPTTYFCESMCFDGIKNQDEGGVDCGGVCKNSNLEICNGIDDNNNCKIDDNPINALLNPNQVGVCAGSKQTCTASNWFDDYSGVSGYQSIESSCSDGLDNDCDGSVDCADPDCAGKAGPTGVTCCQAPSNCAQDDCVDEACVNNVCVKNNREKCAADECIEGQYCDALGGNCADPDVKSDLCVPGCAVDKTSGDGGILYSTEPTCEDGAFMVNFECFKQECVASQKRICVAEQTYCWPGTGWCFTYCTGYDLVYDDCAYIQTVPATKISNVLTDLYDSDGLSCSNSDGGSCFDANDVSVKHKLALTQNKLCCGDDINEYYQINSGAYGECTNNANDCVWSSGDAQADNTGNSQWWCFQGNWNECTPAVVNTQIGSVICSGAGWYVGSTTEPDLSSGLCGISGYDWLTGGESDNFGGYGTGTSTSCCGDDANEFEIVLGVGNVACCNSGSKCVDINNICRENVIENTAALCSDGIDNDCDGNIDCADSDCNPDIAANCCVAAIDVTPKNWDPANNILEDNGIAYGTDLFDSDASGCPIASCELGEVCTCFNSVESTVTHKAAITSGLCCGDDPGEFYKLDPLTGGAECTSNINDCVWPTGDAQISDTGNINYWCFDGTLEPCLSSADVGKTHGSVVCAGAGTGWTLNPDPENTYGPNACSDFDDEGNPIDNDADGFANCADTDCAGSISGNVKDTEDNNIQGARVDIIRGTTVEHTASTDVSGNYQTTDPVLCGDYNMVASASGYVSSTQTITLQPNEQLQNVNFNLILGSTCEDDCTYAGDNTVHQECDGINNCAFFDETAKTVCDLAQPGWIRDYDGPACTEPQGCVIECAEGTPQPKVEVKAKITCDEENLIKNKNCTYKNHNCYHYVH